MSPVSPEAFSGKGASKSSNATIITFMQKPFQTSTRHASLQFINQYLTRFCTITLTDHTVTLHALYHAGGPIISYPHTSLQVGYGCLPRFSDQRHRLVIEFIIIVLFFNRGFFRTGGKNL